MRPTCLLLLACLPLAAVADQKSEFEARYRGLDLAIASGDFPKASKWVEENATADFQYLSNDKHLYLKKPFIEGIRQQIAATKKVMVAKTKVASVQVKGSVASLQVDSDTTAIMTVDSKRMKLVDQSRCTDTWVKVGNRWLIKKSVQTKADTQMFPL